MKSLKLAIAFIALFSVLNLNATKATSGAEMLQNMQKKVTLSADQSAKAKVIFDHYFELKAQCEKQYQGEALKMNLKRVEKESITKFRALLTPEQKATYQKQTAATKPAAATSR